MGIRSHISDIIDGLKNRFCLGSSPHGADFITDIRKCLPNFTAHRVFDVGANVGRTAKDLRDWFPCAQIFCFEPSSKTFRELRQNVAHFKNVQCFHLAVGSSVGKGKLLLGERSTLSCLVRNQDDYSSYDNQEIEEVEITTVCAFCKTHEIDHIDILRLDTEGHDFEVLKGSGELIDTLQIDMIDLLVAMNYKNTKHIAFEVVQKYLENRGYFLFGIYQQCHELFTGQAYMRRANAVFISERVIEMNRSNRRVPLAQAHED